MWKNIAEVVNTFRGLGFLLLLTRCLDRSSPKKGWMCVKRHFVVVALNGHTHTLSFVLFCFVFFTIKYI